MQILRIHPDEEQPQIEFSQDFETRITDKLYFIFILLIQTTFIISKVPESLWTLSGIFIILHQTTQGDINVSSLTTTSDHVVTATVKFSHLMELKRQDTLYPGECFGNDE